MPWNFDLIGYCKVFGDGAIASYYMNSIVVTVGTIFFTLLFGAMAAWALTEYKFRWNTLLAIFLSIGIMVPYGWVRCRSFKWCLNSISSTR